MAAGHSGRLNLLRHLELFVAVAEERHFGRAAARLGMAQPPVSQGIRRLESSFEVVLFDRGRTGALLTAAGRELLPRARVVLADTADLRAVAGRHARAGRRVHLGVVPELGARWAADAAAAATAHGGARVEVVTASSVSLVDQLVGELLDLAVVVHPIPLAGLTAGSVVELPTEVLLPAEHRAASRPGPVALRALADLEFATGPRSSGPAAFDLLVDTLDLRGGTARVVGVPDVTAALALVAGGRAFALCADPDLGAAGVVRRPLAGGPISLRVRLVHGSGPGQEEAAEAVSHTLARTARPSQ